MPIARPLYDPLVTSLRHFSLLSIGHVYGGLYLRLALIFLIEAIYSGYLKLFGPRIDEEEIIAHLARENRDDQAVAIVTGATAGLGKEISIGLLRSGYTLHLPVRNMEKGERVASEMRRLIPGARIHLYPCDMASSYQVAAFIRAFCSSSSRLDLLVSTALTVLTICRQRGDGGGLLSCK